MGLQEGTIWGMQGQGRGLQRVVRMFWCINISTLSGLALLRNVPHISERSTASFHYSLHRESQTGADEGNGPVLLCCPLLSFKPLLSPISPLLFCFLLERVRCHFWSSQHGPLLPNRYSPQLISQGQGQDDPMDLRSPDHISPNLSLKF